MHIMHNLEIEYLCLGTPMAANILNLLVSRWEWSFAHHTVIYLAYQYTPFHCKHRVNLDWKCVFWSFCIERLYENVLGQADFHLIQ